MKNKPTYTNYEIQEDDKIFRIETKDDFFVIKMINCNELILKKDDFYKIMKFIRDILKSEAREEFHKTMRRDNDEFP